MMKLYRTADRVLACRDGDWFAPAEQTWDRLLTRDDLPAYLAEQARTRPSLALDQAAVEASVLKPIVSQEVWAAGVTYFRSRDARMEESEASGGAVFYDRVYDADRPELFFKATAHRTVDPGQPIRIRADASWNVPEPELTAVITPSGKVIGYTIGNDVSSRDIEGENPLYLPQAKVYMGSCALGPAVLVSDAPLPPETRITLRIDRAGASVFEGETTLAMLKRSPADLASWLMRDNAFPHGALLMTGAGVVPDKGFTLASGDLVHIAIEGIGELTNPVA